MKKLYVIFCTLLIIGISTGIYYFSEYRESKMNFPKEIVMTTHTGSTFSFEEMAPKVRLLEFIYTACPDICPTTTFQMKKLQNQLTAAKVFDTQVEFLTVTIDPTVDTEQTLNDYAANFDAGKTAGWEFLRGSVKDTQKLADQFNFQYRESGNGDFVHTSATYLLDKNNRVIKVFGMGEDSFDKDKVYARIMKEVK